MYFVADLLRVMARTCLLLRSSALLHYCYYLLPYHCTEVHIQVTRPKTAFTLTRITVTQTGILTHVNVSAA